MTKAPVQPPLAPMLARSMLMASFMLGAAPVLAQAGTTGSPADAPLSFLGNDETADIIVTAQRREQRLQDVPVSVSVVSGASLQRQNLTSLEDVASRLPDVKIAPGTISNSIVIRGVGSGANAGFEQSVATFVDGVYRSRSRSTRAALFDIDRVEVLKGPQTTFFGANAIAGALNIVTRKPTDQLDYNASVYGVPSIGEYEGQLGASLPLGETLSARIAGRLSRSDGYIKNTFLNEDGPRDRTVQGRFSLAWHPSSAFRSDLRIEGSRSRTRGALAAQLIECPPPAGFTVAPVNTCGRYLRQNNNSIDDQLDYRTAIGRNYVNYKFLETSWTNQLEVGTGSLNANTSYFEHRFASEGQAVPFPLTDAVGGTNGYPTYLNEHFDQFSQELRYQSATGGMLEYMFGGYYSKGDLDTRTIAGFRFLPFGANDRTGRYNAASPLAGNNYASQNDRTLSAFASATIRPVTGVRVNLGARYSSIRKQASRLVAPGLSDNDVTPGSFQSVDAASQAVIAAILATNTANFPNPKRTDNKFMPSASVQYDLTRDMMVYASYANGFKAGGYSFGANNEQFEPERVNAYEAGVKGKFLDGLLTGDLAVYRSDYRNLQESTLQLQTNGTIASLIQNVARSRSQGVELNASVRASSWLTLSSNVAYLSAKYTSYENGACTLLALAQAATCRQNLSGRRRSYAPAWSGNVGARVTVPVGAFYRVTVDPLLYFSSRFFLTSTADPLLEQRGYSKIDLRAGFGPLNGRWEVALIGRNLTDKVTSQFRQSIPLAPGSVAAVVDPPRTVGIQLTFKR